jgi:tetratricopeptide (TPR) repeat protein
VKYGFKIILACWACWALIVSDPFTGAAQRRGSPPDPNLLAAENYLQQKNYAKAAEALDLILKMQPKTGVETYLMRAVCYVNLNAADQAVEIIERGLAAYPASPRLTEYHAALLEQSQNADGAKEKLQRLTRQWPRVVAYCRALARLLMKREPSSQVTVQALKSLASLIPRDAEAHYLYGQWACVQQQHALCVAELSRALALTGDNNLARMQMGAMIALAEVELNRPVRAEAAFREAFKANMKLERPNPRAALQFAEFLTKQNRDEDAQRVVDEILKFSPNFGPAWFERARYLARRRQLDKAIEAGDLALRYADGETEHLRAVHAFMAKTCFAAGRADDARIHQEWVEKQSKYE